MSRIGYTPIQIPENVEVNVDKNNRVTVKGEQGELSRQLDPQITITVEDDEISFERPSEKKKHKALHGMVRSVVSNMVQGVKEGFKVELEMRGIGFRAKVQGNKLTLELGFAHDIVFGLPEEVEVEVDTDRGDNPVIIVQGIDKHLVGQVAAKIRSLKPPEPYKGKGIRYVGEDVKRKEGKVAAAATEA